VKKVEYKGDDKNHKMAEESASRHELVAPLTWAQRLKRVFNIDITLCVNEHVKLTYFWVNFECQLTYITNVVKCHPPRNCLKAPISWL